MNKLIRFTTAVVCAALLAVPLAAQEQAEPVTEPAAAPAAEQAAPEAAAAATPNAGQAAAPEAAAATASNAEQAATPEAESAAAPDAEQAAAPEAAEAASVAEAADETESESAAADIPEEETVVAEQEPEAEEPAVEDVAAEPAGQRIEEIVPSVQVAVSETKTEVVNRESDRYYMIYSLRPELSVGLAESSNDIGGVIGFGIVHDKIYAGADISGGAYYFGGDANVGVLLRNSECINNIVGLSLGFWKRNSTLKIVDKTRDIKLGEEDESTFNFGGLFWKFLYGKQSNLDITNKFLFGYRDEITAHASNNDEGYAISKQKKFAATYSLSVGFTIKKSRNY